jgi:outer membrane protein OmpA-like peptidoglycan-associated protein
MPGGIGGTDIYYCKREGLAWGNPTNAGPVINTEGSEMFPFIHSDGTLYYSSDGLFGLGGLDIFMAAAREDSTGFEHPINLAKPLNSSSDDFAFIISENKSDGYLSSNREAGKGDDDIYHFKIDFPILEDILDPSNFDDPVANRDSVPTLEGVTDNDIHLGQIYKLENIYYDFDKWNIRPDAQVELIKVIIFMQKFPKVKVELGSHTDCRAPNAYNERLSQRRATSAVNWIVTRGGIDPARITAQGYGERVLTNECADGVHCSEAKHQLNRRTEIKIVEK